MTAPTTDRTPPAPLDTLVRTSLVVCDGGPKAGEVFYAGDIADRQRAALRCRTPHTPREALAVLLYRPTTRTRKVKAGKAGWVDADVLAFRPLELVRDGGHR